MITGTKQQEAIWHELANGTGDVSMLVWYEKHLQLLKVETEQREIIWLFCFNKSIQTELAERLPDNVEAKHFMHLDLLVSFSRY